MTFKPFAIGIPTLNRMDLLEPTLHIYLRDFSCEIFVLDNGHQQHNVQNERLHYIDQQRNIGVATSWNVLCRQIFDSGYENALILNDDIMLGVSTAAIAAALQLHKGRLVTTIVDWCAFLLPKQLFEKVGPFDENFFPAYYEDKDYERRLRINGQAAVKSALLSPAVYRSNMTAEKDNSVHVAAYTNKEYFIRKWGGLPGGEKYNVPFNEKPKK